MTLFTILIIPLLQIQSLFCGILYLDHDLPIVEYQSLYQSFYHPHHTIVSNQVYPYSVGFCILIWSWPSHRWIWVSLPILSPSSSHHCSNPIYPYSVGFCILIMTFPSLNMSVYLLVIILITSLFQSMTPVHGPWRVSQYNKASQILSIDFQPSLERSVLFGGCQRSNLHELWINSKCVLRDGVQVQLCRLWTSFSF